MGGQAVAILAHHVIRWREEVTHRQAELLDDALGLAAGEAFEQDRAIIGHVNGEGWGGVVVGGAARHMAAAVLGTEAAQSGQDAVNRRVHEVTAS